MFLSPPDGTALERRQPVPEGTKIAIGCPARGRRTRPIHRRRRLSNPLHPARVEIVRDGRRVVNTARMFLQGFDYLYDAAGGYVGYGWTGRAGSATAAWRTGR